MKLNNKGYMLVEIVISFVFAIGLSYYLLNLTYKFKDTNEDIYQSYFYNQDKILITKNIMSDFYQGEIRNVSELNAYNVDGNNGNYVDFDFIIDGNLVKKRLMVIKKDGVTKICYGVLEKNGDDYFFDINSVSYYEKDLETTLIVGDLKVEVDSLDGYVTGIIPISAVYTNRDYSIKFFGKYIGEV